MNLRFHWMLPKGGEAELESAQATARVLTTKDNSLASLPDMQAWIAFAQAAETAGIEAVLMSFSRYEPDTLMCACALGMATHKLRFIAAYRLGLMQPTTFVQQLNTVSQLIDGRIAINVVAGSSPAEQRGYGDFLAHNERYARAEEFLSICHAFWRSDEAFDFTGKYYRLEAGQLNTPYLGGVGHAPEIYVAGHSKQAEHLACGQGSAWLRLIDTPENLAPIVTLAREHNIELCIRLCIVCRTTREAAIEAAVALIPDDQAIGREEREILTTSDSKTLAGALAQADEIGWLSPSLWAGLVPYYGSSAITLVGSPNDIANAFLEYKRIGITQFIISGWPKQEEMTIFGRDVLPLVRQFEHKTPLSSLQPQSIKDIR